MNFGIGQGKINNINYMDDLVLLEKEKDNLMDFKNTRGVWNNHKYRPIQDCKNIINFLNTC